MRALSQAYGDFRVSWPAGVVARPVALAALGLASFLFLAVTMNRTIGIFDEGLILEGADRVANGAIPHRDFFTMYGPGQFYIVAALYKAFGASVLVERAWDTTVRAIAVVLAYVVVRQTAPRSLAILAATACLIWLASFQGYGYPVFPCLDAALAGVAVLGPLFQGADSHWRLIGAGICAGAATLFRYDVGVAAFGAECLVLVCCIASQGHSLRRTLLTAARCIGWFAVGFAAIVVPLACGLALAGAIPGLIFDTITYPARFYVEMRAKPFPTSGFGTRMPLFAVYLPPLLCLAAVPSLIVLLRHSWRNPWRPRYDRPRPVTKPIAPWALATLVLLTLVFLAKGFVRVDLIQMAIAIVAAVIVAAVLIQPMHGRGRIGQAAAIVAATSVYFFTLLMLVADIYVATQNLAWADRSAAWTLSSNAVPSASDSCRVPPDLAPVVCFPIDADRVAVIRYVQRHTAPDDPVFIGLYHHDKILFNDVALYFEMGRKPATKWYEFDPGIQTTAQIQRAMIVELARVQPKVIVLEPNPADVIREPNGSAISSGVTLLDDYIRQAYRPVKKIGTYLILRPRRHSKPR